VKEEFYQVAFRKKRYTTLEEIQADLDIWIQHDHIERTHSGRYCDGRTPMTTWRENLPLVREKMLETYLTDMSPQTGEVSD